MPLLIVAFSVSGQTNFVGSELISNVTAPGKIKIKLRVFYSVAQNTVPESEIVSVAGESKTSVARGIVLAKEGEYIDVKYPVILKGNENIRSAIKSITYTGIVNLGASKGAYDIMWTHGELPTMLMNVEARSGDVIALSVHINDVQKVDNNSSPMLVRLPVYRISSSAKTICPVNVQDDDRIDKVEAVLSAPLVCNAPGKSGIVAKRALIKEVNFRDGFSGDRPCGASCTYDKDAKEFIFEQTAFGNYLCALKITDSRNTEPLSSHQAIFIITSIL